VRFELAVIELDTAGDHRFAHRRGHCAETLLRHHTHPAHPGMPRVGEQAAAVKRAVESRDCRQPGGHARRQRFDQQIILLA